jgi:hypothetical protein
LLQGHRNNPPLQTPLSSLQSVCSQRQPPP